MAFFMQESTKKQRKGRSLEKDKSKWGWIFIAPWILGITVFFVWPMIESFTYSVSKLNVTAGGFSKTFVGFDNFRYFFVESTDFLPCLSQTVLGLIPSVLMILAFSMLIALILKENFRGRGVARAVFFFPVVIASGVVITILKDQVMMSGSSVADMSPGYLFQAPNLVEAFAALHIPENILNSITQVINQIFDLTWKSGVQILLLQAAISNIPASFFEAGVMEGATAWEKFWKITFPTISPTLLVVIIYTIIDSFTDYGNQIMQMMRSYYTSNNYTYSATIGVIYFICVLLLIGVVELLCKKFIFYSDQG